MHGYLAYPPQAYQHNPNQASHSSYMQHMPAPIISSAQQLTAQSQQQQQLQHQHQHQHQQQQQQTQYQLQSMATMKENGYYKRYSDVKTSNRTNESVPEAKKARYDMNTPNTKVVSLRNIPNDIVDLQIVFMGLEFGDVVNILYIKAKGQALIEFTNINEANEMIKHFRAISEHSMLKSVEAAHSSYQYLTIETGRITSTANTIQMGKQLKEAAMHGCEGSVIKAAISNIVYPISINDIYQVFSKYGNVLKILLIPKNEPVALIQMKDDLQAQQAIHNLNGRNMFNTYTGGCNTLNLQISPHKALEIKFNNSKSWDYTNPLLLMIERPDNAPKNSMIAEHPLLPVPMNMGGTSGMPAYMNNQGPSGSIAPISGQNAAGASSMQYGAVQGTQNVAGYQMQPMDTRSCVVQVSNFPDQIANPDALFTLFGVYGDILKVKIMYNRRDNALMQFKTYEQALIAVAKLDKVKLWEKVLQVGLSKFPEIQIPIKNDGGLAKDYSNSPLHRFKKPGSKNFYNIFQPNQTLHLSNISPQTTEENIRELFRKHGNINNFKWISKEGNKMALLEMGSIEEAVLALIALHNFQLNGSYLRVNFAK